MIHQDPLDETVGPDLHWSTDNIGEALPGVLTPLGWTVWKGSVSRAGIESAFRVGVLSRSERMLPPDGRQMVQCFAGRAGMQTEFYALIGDRMPGTSGQQVVEGILGRVPEDMTFTPTRSRYPVIAWRLPRTLLTAPREARALAAETDAWWRATVPRLDSFTLPEATRTFGDALERFAKNQVMQGVVVFGVVSPLFSALTKLIERAGTGDLATLSGGGGAEMAIVTDIWRAAKGELDVDAVLANHGFHGPREGEVSARVWRENPEPLRQVIKEYAQRDASQDPTRRQAAARAALPSAQREVLANLPKPMRPVARLILTQAAAGIPLRGVSKRGFLQSIDIARGAARRIGALLAIDGVIADPEDVFYLTTDEVMRVTELPDLRSVITARREQRARHEQVQLPGAWKGVPASAQVQVGGPRSDQDSITGIGVSDGIVEGRVRVVTDPTFADVEPDEVLVAPTTDPSWSAIMFISAALVVDIGGPLSHAAVVARELGIPCVVNTRTGSTALRTGDLVRVDGHTGRVEILQRTK